MEKKLHILILEDIPSDAELARRELNTVLKDYTVQVVDTEEGFVQSLRTFKPDLIISDYQLPTFDGLSALKITQEKFLSTPFVILTGSMNEDTAVECIKAGADDYVIKE
ncbi:MAG: response regulator, partial [Candidatus Marinimicrobia bacterium]|nr:response regulator [Candidatus Neomarinimicrobiota bacterium]